MYTLKGIFSFGAEFKLLHDNDRLAIVSVVWGKNL